MASLALALGACSDGPVSVRGGAGEVFVAPQLSFNGAAAGLPIERIRMTPLLLEGGSAGEPQDTAVHPADERWEVRARVDIGERDSAMVVVHVEMLSLASGPTVEWSGVVGPVMVRADASTAVQTSVEMFRGPLENQLVDSIQISGPSQLATGESHALHAYVETRGTSHTVLWTSSDHGVLTVDPVGDSVQVHATGGGSALIVAAAGTKADTLEIFVDTTTAGPIAQVVAYPDSAVVTLGSSRAWQAYALDAQGTPVIATLTWQSLDPAVAGVTSEGIVTGEALGRARIVVSASGFADTVIVKVEPLPEGVDMLWQGGTPGFEEDWFTADNWSPAQVPGVSSVIYVASTPYDIRLTGNASVGAILSDSLGAWIYLGTNTLTVHGDVRLGYNAIHGDPGSLLLVDAPSAALSGWLPATTLTGTVTAVGDLYMEGDLAIDGTARPASLDLASDRFVFVYGSTRLTNSHLVMLETALSQSYFHTEGDMVIDGGDSRNSLSGGVIVVGGDFSVSAATCTAFVPTGTEVHLYSDTARVSIGCSSRTGNHFSHLLVYSSTSAERLLYLDTDISVTNQLFLEGGSGTRVLGNGVTIDAAAGYAYAVTLDHVFLHVDLGRPDETFWMDSVTITGMTGETRPQLRYTHPGDPCGCYWYHHVIFDPTSAGPYIEAIDPTADADTLTLYMQHNPGDGPQRTVTSGGARVHWADVPYYLVYWSGSGQTGASNQPLPDSLRAQVVDYGFNPVAGVAIDWTVIEGNGSVSPATSATDTVGIAATQFTLGDTTSGSHAVIATTAALPADTVYYYGYPSGAPSGSSTPAVEAAGQPAAPIARLPRPQHGIGARAREPVGHEMARPERPAARPQRTLDGDRP